MTIFLRRNRYNGSKEVVVGKKSEKKVQKHDEIDKTIKKKIFIEKGVFSIGNYAGNPIKMVPMF